MSVRIAWVTDPHLNFLNSVGCQNFFAKVKATGANAVVVTGDISEGDRVVKHVTDMQNAIDMPLYFVLGNHDYYKSSVLDVRKRIRAACRANSALHWLRETIIELTPTTALVGIDGWADAKLGAPHLGRLGMADWELIDEYVQVQAKWDMQKRMQLAQQLGWAEAETLGVVLSKAVEKYTTIVVATHIPPFKEATWHQGKHSDDDWLPWFSCKQVGDVLAGYANKYPLIKFVTLCGHTHGSGEYQHSDNLVVRTGAAAYSKPKVSGVLVF